MDTWTECAWFKCRKRFEPNRYANQYYRADGRHHEGRRYCSRSCQQKAYRLRRDKCDDCKDTITQGTVTRPQHRTENIEVAPTKNDHARRSFVLPVGYAYSDWQPWPPSRWQPIGSTPRAADTDDLSIPDFLRRQL